MVWVPKIWECGSGPGNWVWLGGDLLGWVESKVQSFHIRSIVHL